METAEERIYELGGTSIEIIQSEEQRGQKTEKQSTEPQQPVVSVSKDLT